MILLTRDLLNTSTALLWNSETTWNLKEKVRVFTSMERREYSWRLRRTRSLSELEVATWQLKSSLSSIAIPMLLRTDSSDLFTVDNAKVIRSSRLSTSLKRLSKMAITDQELLQECQMEQTIIKTYKWRRRRMKKTTTGIWWAATQSITKVNRMSDLFLCILKMWTIEYCSYLIVLLIQY